MKYIFKGFFSYLLLIYNGKRLYFLLLFLLSLMSATASTQADTIGLKNKLLNTAFLKPGLKQYLVYSQDPEKDKSLGFWFWLRDIRISEHNGEKVFATTQHWYGSDSSSYRTIYSLNKTLDFSPLYHSETVHGKIKAYNWFTNKIVGADSVINNAEKNFSLNFSASNFNWNLDIETFEMLPLSAGKSFVINFYDAGLDAPAYVIYKVIGSDMLSTLDNHIVGCWKLFTEGDSKGIHYSETYWISKKNHEFLKEEDYYNNTYRYKIKLPAAAVNLMARFNK